MSKQSKMRNKKRHAKQFKGTKGPARTHPVHGKTKAWWQTGKFRKAAPAQRKDAANDEEGSLAA